MSLSFLNRSSLYYALDSTNWLRSFTLKMNPAMRYLSESYQSHDLYQVRPYNNLLESFFSEVQGALTFTCLARVCGQSKFLTMIITQ